MKHHVKKVGQLAGIMAGKISGSKSSIMHSHIPLIIDVIVSFIRNKQPEEAVRVLDFLELSLEDFKDSLIGLCQYHPTAREYLRGLSKRSKSAFTRIYREIHPTSHKRHKRVKSIIYM